MEVRDSFATLNNDTTIMSMPSGALEIVADDGRTLFYLRVAKDGSLEVSGGDFCKHDGLVLEERISVLPRASNVVYIRKELYAGESK